MRYVLACTCTCHDDEGVRQQTVAARSAVAQFEMVQGVGPETGHFGLALVPQRIGIRRTDLWEGKRRCMRRCVRMC